MTQCFICVTIHYTLLQFRESRLIRSKVFEMITFVCQGGSLTDNDLMRIAGGSLAASAFLQYLLLPYVRKMITGNFSMKQERPQTALEVADKLRSIANPMRIPIPPLRISRVSA